MVNYDVEYFRKIQSPLTPTYRTFNSKVNNYKYKIKKAMQN